MDLEEAKNSKGKTVWLTEEAKGFPAGTKFVAERFVPLGPEKSLLMVKDPANEKAAAETIPVRMLSFTPPGEDEGDEEPAGGDEGGVEDGPVKAYFEQYANLERALDQHFLTNYTHNFGPFNDDILKEYLSAVEVPVDTPWTLEQAIALYEMHLGAVEGEDAGTINAAKAQLAELSKPKAEPKGKGGAKGKTEPTEAQKALNEAAVSKGLAEAAEKGKGGRPKKAEQDTEWFRLTAIRALGALAPMLTEVQPDMVDDLVTEVGKLYQRLLVK